MITEYSDKKTNPNFAPVSTINAVIIEDEKKGLLYLKNILEKHCPQVKIVAELQSIKEGLDYLNHTEIEIELAFLDIQFPDGNIFQLLDQLEDIPFHIIFTTAYNEYAVQAFRYSALDYLLKPINPEDLVETVDKLINSEPKEIGPHLEMFEQHYNHPNVFEKFIINGMDGMHFINFRDITRCQGNDNYTYFYLRDGTKIVVAKTLGDFEDLLKGAYFYRIHKSHLINLNYMKRYANGVVIMDDTVEIEVARRRRKLFMDRIKALNDRFRGERG